MALSFAPPGDTGTDRTPAAPEAKAAAALGAQNQVLGLLATGADLGTVLRTLASALEGLVEGARVGIYLVAPEGDLLQLATPPVAPDLAEPIPIGPRMGSCGTAAHLRERVVVPDIAQSPAFEAVRDRLARVGVRASWSQPIFASGSREVLGTIALYHDRVRAPEQDDTQLVEDAASLAGLAIERTRAADALRASEEKLRRLVEHASDVIFSLDVRGRITFAASNLERCLGRRPASLYGRSITGEIHPDDRERCRAAFRQVREQRLQVARLELRASHADGSWRDLAVSLSPLTDAGGTVSGVVGVAQDVSERKSLEAQLVLADRLASVGTLAAGVAHEVNNPLCYVASSLAFMETELAGLAGRGLVDPAHLTGLRDAMADAVDGVRRVEAIVSDLRTLSRMEDDHSGTARADEVLAATLRMTAKPLEHRAELEVDIPRELPAVRGSDARLGQVFSNLLTNALHAFPDRPREANRLRIAARPAGRAVVVEVEDNGEGMAKDVAERIFEPFFTTKPQGVGTGLGLPIARGIVQALGGAITVSSRPGKGTCFRVSLPVAGDATHGPGAPAAGETAAAEAELPARRTRVLLVDDEAPIGRSLARALRDEHLVDTAVSAEEALALLKADPEYDAVLCDLMMPGMTGMALYRRIADHYPALAPRIGFLTGGAFTDEGRRFVEEMRDRVLDKPFRPADLRRLVARLTV